jgi:citronellol/citronellal dehydrogenase
MIPGVDISALSPAGKRAAWQMPPLSLTTPARELTGRFLIDDEVLRERGVDDFTSYAVDPERPPLPDLFLDAPRV